MPLIKRDLYKKLKKHLSQKEISLIVGARQVGKTTLMKELENYLKEKNQRTVFLNLDYENDKQFFLSQEKLIQKLKLELGEKPGYVFIDEIQRKKNAGIFLKGIFDLNLPYKFIVSGSGSLELKEKIHESLAGRKRFFQLRPINFLEFAAYKTQYSYRDNLKQFFGLEKKCAREFLEEYLNFGGYPRVVLEKQAREKNQIINEIFSSYVEKDITSLLEINRADAFILLIKILSSQIGQIINHSRLAQEIGISVATLKNYLWYAEKTFSINTMRPFAKNKRKEITKAPVIYFQDLGLRNFSLDLIGKIALPEQLRFVFQNFVANALGEKIQNTSLELRFWRTLDRSEVDFILTSGKEIIPIEVKYSAIKNPVVGSSLRSFIKKYRPREAWIVNLSLEKTVTIEKTRVKFRPFYKIL